MLCSTIQRRSGARQVTRQTRRHDNTPSPSLAMLGVLPHPVHRELHRVVRRLHIYIDGPPIRLGQFPITVEFILKKLVLIFRDPGIHVHGVDVTELVDRGLEGCALRGPGRDVAFLEEEIGRGEEGCGGRCGSWGGAVEDYDVVGGGGEGVDELGGGEANSRGAPGDQDGLVCEGGVAGFVDREGRRWGWWCHGWW